MTEIAETVAAIDSGLDRVATLALEKQAAYVNLYTLCEELVESVPKDLEWQAEGYVNIRIRQLAKLKAAL